MGRWLRGVAVAGLVGSLVAAPGLTAPGRAGTPGDPDMTDRCGSPGDDPTADITPAEHAHPALDVCRAWVTPEHDEEGRLVAVDATMELAGDLGGRPAPSYFGFGWADASGCTQGPTWRHGPQGELDVNFEKACPTGRPFPDAYDFFEEDMPVTTGGG